jgi:spore germination cell wall hydrolase CwlJ-like protein
MKLILILGAILCSLLIVDKKFKEPFYSERDTLAAIINAECGSCPIMDQYLTGSVVINRVNSGEFPNNIRSVVRERNQFHGYKSRQYKPTKKTRKVADDLMQGVFLVPNIVYFCTYNSSEPMDSVTIFGISHKYGL